jgi:hypothetical protein
MNKFNKFIDSFSNKTTSSNRADRESKALVINAKDGSYPRFIDQIKNAQHFKYIGQKIAHDITECDPQFREVLRLIRANKPNGNPYNWDHNGHYIVNQSDIMDFPMLKKSNGEIPTFTKEALKAFSERCYCCGMAECPGKNSPDCVYHNKTDSWFLCDNCCSGFHQEENCKAFVADN